MRSGAVRASDPVTSHQAAVLPRVTLKRRVYDALRDHPRGMTDWELARFLFADPVEAAAKKPTVGKRREELGCVARRYSCDGPPITRLSPTGQECQVWVLPESQERAA